MLRCMTTSWDDGHPLDFRVAELLTKYGLQGTFYVPPQAQTATMSAGQLRELSARFEIGAHTMQHVRLTSCTPRLAAQEIAASKGWVEDVTGRPCTMFCPPGGCFRGEHLGMIREAGYTGLRTVEFLSLDAPRLQEGLRVLPTSVQAYPHTPLAYARNLAKRGAWRNAWLYVRHGSVISWRSLARGLLEYVAAQGGVFHLWGHSWELQQTRQWQRLEEVLKLMSTYHEVPCVSNGALCALAPPAPREMPATPTAA